MSWWRWFGSRRGDPEADKLELDAEIEAHLAMAAADARSRGLDDATAQREAQREFGNVALVKDVTREAWGWVWLERVQQDLKYALRQMAQIEGLCDCGDRHTVAGNWGSYGDVHCSRSCAVTAAALCRC